MNQHTFDKAKILRMSLRDKILRAFRIFPNDRAYFALLVDGISLEIPVNFFTGSLYFEFSLEDIEHVGLCAVPIGTLSKYFERDIDGDCVLIFRTPHKNNTDEGEEFRAHFAITEEANSVCEIALKFMLSLGKNRSDIPLLVNMWPEFAKYALAWRA